MPAVVTEEKSPLGLYRPSRAMFDKIARIYERFLDMKRYRQDENLEGDWNKWEKQFLPGEATRDADVHEKNPSKVKSALTWTNIQTAISMVVDQRPEIQLIANSDEDRRKSLIMQAVYDYTWEKCKGDIELFFLVLSAAIYGTGIWEESYRVTKRKIKEITEYDPGEEMIRFKESEIEDYNDVVGEVVDLRMFYIDEKARNMEDARDCIKRRLVPFPSLEYQYPKSIFPNVTKVQSGSYFESAFNDLRDKTVHSQIGEDEVEIIEYWNKERDERIIIANGVILLDMPNPYKHKQLPFVRLPFFPRDREHFYGIGIAELLEHPQATLDTFINLIIARTKLSLSKPIFHNSGETFETPNLELEPGMLVEVNDINGVREFDIDPPDAVTFEVYKKVEEEAKYLVGTDDPMFGVKSGGTATENAIAKESSLRKMKVFLRILEQETMVRLARLRIANIQYFYAKPLRVERIVGTGLVDKIASFLNIEPERKMKPIYRSLPIDFRKEKTEMGVNFTSAEGEIIELLPEDYMGNFDVKVKPNSSIPISRALMQQQKTDMLVALAPTPIGQMMMANNMEGWRKFGVDYFYDWNMEGEKYLPDGKTIFDELKELAVKENNAMMNGITLAPTGGAIPDHSARHLALINSKDFLNLDSSIQQVVITHYEGELKAQKLAEARQTMLAAQGQGAPVVSAGQATSPGMASLSPAQTNTGAPPAPRSISNQQVMGAPMMPEQMPKGPTL